MAFQSVPNCAQAEVIFTCNGVTMEHSLKFHYTGIGSYSQADLSNLALVLNGWVNDFYKPLLSADVTFSRVEVTGLTDENDLTALSVANAGVGAVGSAPVPFNVSLAVKFGTGFTGRSARGRAYMIGIPVSVIASTDNYVNTTYQTDVIELWSELNTYTTPEDWEFVIVSRFHNGAKRTTATFKAVTDYVLVDARVDSQRGRLPG